MTIDAWLRAAAARLNTESARLDAELLLTHVLGLTRAALYARLRDELDADAVLLNPYMGFDAIEPFVRRKDKLVILCVNTSNPSADEVQNLRKDYRPWEIAAQAVFRQ